MKETGIVREFDGVGRLVIPMEIRKVNGWKKGTPMEIFSSDDGLVIREYAPATDEGINIAKDIEAVQYLTENDEVFKIMQRAKDFLSK